MKIAVASDDGLALSPHFGRSRYFLVFDVNEGRVSGPETRANQATAFALGECDSHSHGHHAHSHDALVAVLHDCQVVMAGGMGKRAALDLESHGIQPMVVSFAGPATEAVKEYLSGSLKSSGTWCCGH